LESENGILTIWLTTASFCGKINKKTKGATRVWF
jgi:hypothetical protein